MLLYWVAILIAQREANEFLLSVILAPLGALAVAYLVRIVIRAFDDPSRVERATRVAAVGALLWAAGLFGEQLVGFVVSVSPSIASQATPLVNAVAVGFELASDSLGVALLVVAFGLGLADPLRPMPKDWAAVAG